MGRQVRVRRTKAHPPPPATGTGAAPAPGAATRPPPRLRDDRPARAGHRRAAGRRGRRLPVKFKATPEYSPTDDGTMPVVHMHPQTEAAD